MTRSSSHDCHEWTGGNTRKRSWKGFNHTKYQRQPGGAMNCDNRCKPAIVVWPLLSKRIMLNPQLLPNRAVTSNSKVAYLFFKKNGGVEHDGVPERPFVSEVKCCRWILCLVVPHIIQLDKLHTGKFINKKDVLDCIESNSVVGGRSVGRERNLAHTCLGEWL